PPRAAAAGRPPPQAAEVPGQEGHQPLPRNPGAARHSALAFPAANKLISTLTSRSPRPRAPGPVLGSGPRVASLRGTYCPRGGRGPRTSIEDQPAPPPRTRPTAA